ncbi:DUF6286 domain-containing protein [Microbacterium sp. Se5.02b]|uniref:DUF6286 domain-containing protein n=1 Tax=Microbacterium sp. Se5.02b TaxID=2864103 RepID=UPI001C68A97C|nr:DUF6286 domain-containing protein [Microbacterium sp. Se5.02b]QYM65194.1 hypothetical protein K1X59_05140 [Microbacterium sp. Se5.02b]
MTNEQATYRRVLRRETHAPRTIPATVVASIGVVLLLAALVGGAWWLIDEAFRDALARWYGALDAPAQLAVPIGVGVALVVCAIVLLALALLPGRRARRSRTTERSALLVDDGVIADSVAQAVARRTGVDRGRVAVTVGRRMVAVRITPTSGIPVDVGAADAAVNDVLTGIGFAATPRVSVEPDGVIA